ncbi:MAG: flagellar hook-length control protein FliK [Alphaproteobacteria bacterium]
MFEAASAPTPLPAANISPAAARYSGKEDSGFHGRLRDALEAPQAESQPMQQVTQSKVAEQPGKGSAAADGKAAALQMTENDSKVADEQVSQAIPEAMVEPAKETIKTVLAAELPVALAPSEDAPSLAEGSIGIAALMVAGPYAGQGLQNAPVLATPAGATATQNGAAVLQMPSGQPELAGGPQASAAAPSVVTPQQGIAPQNAATQISSVAAGAQIQADEAESASGPQVSPAALPAATLQQAILPQNAASEEGDAVAAASVLSPAGPLPHSALASATAQTAAASKQAMLPQNAASEEGDALAAASILSPADQPPHSALASAAVHTAANQPGQVAQGPGNPQKPISGTKDKAVQAEKLAEPVAQLARALSTTEAAPEVKIVMAAETAEAGLRLTSLEAPKLPSTKPLAEGHADGLALQAPGFAMPDGMLQRTDAPLPGAVARDMPAPAPARQLAPVVVSLALGRGDEALTIALDPGELGRVEVSIGQGKDSGQVRIVAERPETLALLQRDQRELDRALTQAGLGDMARSLSFSLASDQGRQQHHGAAHQGGQRSPGQAVGLESERPMAPIPNPARSATSLLDIAV